MKQPYLFYLFAGLLLPTFAHGQLSNQPDTNTELAIVQKHPLIVLLDEEDPKALHQLAGKPTELAQYKAYLAQYSAQARELAPKVWKLSPTVEFRPASAYKELRNTRKEQAVVLHYTEYNLNATSNNANANLLGIYKARQMECELVGDHDSRTLWRGYSPVNGTLYASDFATTLRCLQADLTRYAAQAGLRMRQSMASEALHQMELGDLLRTKTLLLNEADLRDQLTEATIRTVYPQPVQVVPLATIEAAVLSGDARYTYVRYLASPSGGARYRVLDVATGEKVSDLPDSPETGITKKQLQSLVASDAGVKKGASQRARLQQMLNSH